jgi:hypothetical protein
MDQAYQQAQIEMATPRSGRWHASMGGREKPSDGRLSVAVQPRAKTVEPGAGAFGLFR